MPKPKLIEQTRPVCPDCGSHNTHLAGLSRIGLPRYKCPDCKRGFNLESRVQRSDERANRQEVLDQFHALLVGLTNTEPADTDRYIALGYSDVPLMILEALEAEYGTLPQRPVGLDDFERVQDHFGWMREFRQVLASKAVQMDLWAA